MILKSFNRAANKTHALALMSLATSAFADDVNTDLFRHRFNVPQPTPQELAIGTDPRDGKSIFQASVTKLPPTFPVAPSALLKKNIHLELLYS